MKTATRIEWVDVLKFLGIWAIYIGHFGELSGKLYSFVFLYHVPLFFFAAGLFAPRMAKDLFWVFVKQKALQLMLPYAFFSALAILIATFQYGWGLAEVVSVLKSSLLGVRNTLQAATLWFIPCLYVVVILDYVLLIILKSRMRNLFAAVIIFVISQTLLPGNPLLKPTWFMNIDSALYYYVYFAFGAVLLPCLNKDFSDPRVRSLQILLFTAAFLIATASYFNGGSWLYEKIAPFLPSAYFFGLLPALMSVVCALILIYVNVVAAKTLAKVSFLGNLGRETLIFCGTEDVLKLVLLQLFVMVGLKITFASPLLVIIFSLFCLVVSKYTLVVFLNTYFPVLVGKSRRVDF